MSLNFLFLIPRSIIKLLKKLSQEKSSWCVWRKVVIHLGTWRPAWKVRPRFARQDLCAPLTSNPGSAENLSWCWTGTQTWSGTCPGCDCQCFVLVSAPPLASVAASVNDSEKVFTDLQACCRWFCCFSLRNVVVMDGVGGAFLIPRVTVFLWV